MYITRIKISNFGKFADKEFIFHKGFNIIYGENEAGKTTLHTFIRGMLFGIEKQRGRASSNDVYTKYQPWDNPTYYHGVMDVNIGGIDYRLERNFDKANKSLTVTDIDTGRVLTQAEQVNILDGIDEACYYNTISVGQLGGGTDNQLEGILKNYAANLTSTKNAELDMELAVNSLKDKKKEIKNSVKSDSRQELINEQFSLEERQRQTLVKQEKIQKALEDLQKDFAMASHNVENTRESQTNRKVVEARNQATAEALGDRLAEVRNQITKQNKKLTIIKNEIGKLRNAMDQNNVKNEADIETLENNAGRMPVVPKLVFAIVLVEIIELVMLLMRGNIILGIVLAAATVVTIAIFIGMYITKRREREEYVLAAKRLGVMYRESKSFFKDYHYCESKLSEYAEEERELTDKISAIKIKHNDTEEAIKVESAIARMEQIEEQIQREKWQLEQAREDELQIIAAQENINDKLRLIDQAASEIEAVDMAITNIESIAREISKTFGQDLNRLASSYISEITKGKYDMLYIDEKLNISVRCNDRMIRQERFSTGTSEQIYLALRLAAANLMFDDKKPAILDDTFAHYDNKRMSNTMEFLDNEFEQIILFSCHTREKVVADKIGLKYNLIRL